MDQPNNKTMARELSVARGLTIRYIIALLLVASLSTAAWLSLHLVISAQKSTAAVVNVSGRQRMLSQRTALFSNLLATAPKGERAEIRQKLKDAIDLMAHSHHGLIHGDAGMGLPQEMSPTVRAMYFDGQNPLDTQVETYIKIVNELLLINDELITHDTPQLQYITRTAPATLVKSLDKMVLQYQVEGEAAVGQLQQAETLFWLITLLLLALEAMLIFKPFANHIKDIFDKLQVVTDELRVHQINLERLVKERTNELEHMNMHLAESEEKFRLISTAAKDAIVILNAEAQVIYWNPASEKIFGYDANEIVGKDMHAMLAPPSQREAARKGFERFKQYGVGSLVGKTVEVTALRKSGEEFPIELSISAFWFQHSWHALGVLRDISERKIIENQVRQLAFHDALTALPNRRLFSECLGQAMAECKRNERHGALLFLDLDNFKPLNDEYGHAVGDLLLIDVAKRLKGCLREMDSVGRIGGDEFVVLLKELDEEKNKSAAQAEVIAEKIRAAISQPYILTYKQEDGADMTVTHHCTASIGIALFVGKEPSQDEVMKWADAAMYKAKDAGENLIRFYAPPG